MRQLSFVINPPAVKCVCGRRRCPRPTPPRHVNGRREAKCYCDPMLPDWMYDRRCPKHHALAMEGVTRFDLEAIC